MTIYLPSGTRAIEKFPAASVRVKRKSVESLFLKSATTLFVKFFLSIVSVIVPFSEEGWENALGIAKMQKTRKDASLLMLQLDWYRSVVLAKGFQALISF